MRQGRGRPDTLMSPLVRPESYLAPTAPSPLAGCEKEYTKVLSFQEKTRRYVHLRWCHYNNNNINIFFTLEEVSPWHEAFSTTWIFFPNVDFYDQKSLSTNSLNFISVLSRAWGKQSWQEIEWKLKYQSNEKDPTFWGRGFAGVRMRWYANFLSRTSHPGFL